MTYISITEVSGNEGMRTLKPAEIKALRKGLGMSRSEFAEAFHLNIRMVEQWEQGRRQPSGATAVLLWLIDHIPQQILKALRNA
jgi:putative transcriptional regulator